MAPVQAFPLSGYQDHHPCTIPTLSLTMWMRWLLGPIPGKMDYKLSNAGWGWKDAGSLVLGPVVVEEEA